MRQSLLIILAFNLLSSIYGQEIKPRFSLNGKFNSIGILKANYDYYCNASMISMNYAITNAHCISDQAKCDRSTLHFTFDGKKFSHSYQCKKLIYSGRHDVDEQYNSGSMDWALIEVNGEPGVIHGYLDFADLFEGYGKDYYQNSSAVVWRLKYNLDGLVHHKIFRVAVPCYSTITTDILGQPYHHIKPEYKNNPCHIQGGNSGSPILNARGEFVGITTVMHLKPDPTKNIKYQIGHMMNHYSLEDLDYISGPTNTGILNQYVSIVDLISEDTF